jgi:hypothetical protein
VGPRDARGVVGQNANYRNGDLGGDDYAPPTQTRLKPVSVAAVVANSRQKPQRVGRGKQPQVARVTDGAHAAGSGLHVYVLGSAGTSVWMVSQ